MIADDVDTLDPQELRERLRKADAQLAFQKSIIDKLTHENALLKRLKFAAKSEAYNAEQKSLLEETLDTDLAAVAAEIEALQGARPPVERQQARREKLPANLPRREIHHEPENTTCGCGEPLQRIGEDVGPRSWTTSRACSRSSATSVAGGCADAARASPRRPCRRTSSTRACRPQASWRRCSWPSGGHHEPNPLGQAQRRRSIRLHPRCPGAAADASCQPYRRAPAAPLEAQLKPNSPSRRVARTLTEMYRDPPFIRRAPGASPPSFAEVTCHFSSSSHPFNPPGNEWLRGLFAALLDGLNVGMP